MYPFANSLSASICSLAETSPIFGKVLIAILFFVALIPFAHYYHLWKSSGDRKPVVLDRTFCREFWWVGAEKPPMTWSRGIEAYVAYPMPDTDDKWDGKTLGAVDIEFDQVPVDVINDNWREGISFAEAKKLRERMKTA